MKQYLSLFRYTKAHRPLMVFAALATLSAAFLDALLINFIKDIVNRGFVQQNVKFLSLFPAYILLFFSFRALAGYSSDFLIQKANFSVLKDMRRSFAKRVLNLPQSFLDQQSLGKVQSSFSYRIEQMSRACTQIILCYARESFLVILLLLIMFIESAEMTVIALLAMPIVYLSYRYTAGLLRKTNLKVQEQVGDMMQLSGQVFANVGDISTYHSKSYFSDRFDRLLAKNYDSELLSGHYTAFLSASLYLVTAVPLALMMVWIFHFGSIPTVGSITALLAALLRIIQPLKILSQLTSDFQKALAAQEEIDRFFKQPLAKEFVSGQTKDISVSNLVFDISGERILDQIGFHFKQGQKVAVVGGSGAGKSTLLQILSKIYPPTSGSMELPQKLAYVRQHHWIFSASIRENLIFNNSVDDELIWSTLNDLDLREVVELLPQSLDTIIGQGDLLLSGGQMQRLCLARAILTGADWLLLDEITSALDRVSERIVMNKIFDMDSGVIVVTHRLNYLSSFDMILLMDQGQVVATGSFDDLLEQSLDFKSFYHRLAKKTETV